MVLDAKVRQDKVFLLVSPYTRTEGALVLQVSPTGAVQRKWRLRFSSVDDTAPSYLSLAGKSICLASTEGSIGCFAIN